MRRFFSALPATILALGLAQGGALASGGPDPKGQCSTCVDVPGRSTAAPERSSPVPAEVRKRRYGSPRALYPLTHPRPGMLSRLFLTLTENVRRRWIRWSSKRAHLAPSAQDTLTDTLDGMARDWPDQGHSVERYKWRWGGKGFRSFAISELRPDGTQISTTSIISVTPNLTVLDPWSGTRSQHIGFDTEASKGERASPFIAIEHRGGREVRYTVTPTRESSNYGHAFANTRYYLQQQHKSVPDALRTAGLEVTRAP